MPSRYRLSGFALIAVVTLGLLLSAAVDAHQREHAFGATAQRATAAASSKGLALSRDASLQAASTHDAERRYVAPAPSCPDGPGGCACCRGFAVLVWPQPEITGSQARIPTPLPSASPRLSLRGTSHVPVATALLMAATRGSRAPPRFSRC